MTQNQYEEKLKKWIAENNVQAEQLHFEKSCHSVAEAALAVGTDESNFVKNICMIDVQGKLIVCIVKGEDRVSTTKVGELLKIEKPKTATPEEILEKTGYPCGGTPSFSYQAKFLIDQRVMEKDVVYSGGGSENSLVRISTIELQKANNGKVVRIRK